ncbi:HIT family protein [Candidatus Micrarchaeota archaeon]|nr:HIT family protein [Candidatus Micrarchaeota archaeon]
MTANHDPCVFCKIVSGEIPSTKVYEDELVFSFLDINPVNPGHLLIIPKVHSRLVREIDPKTVGHIFEVAQKLSIALRNSGLNCEGITFSLADGVAAGQEVQHSHLHLIPRFDGDKFKISFGSSSERPKREDLEKTAQKIKNAI